jgi:capsular polysaccharide biosynthesis protein
MKKRLLITEEEPLNENSNNNPSDTGEKIEEPNVETIPNPPTKKDNAWMWLFIGLLLVLGIIFLKNLMDKQNEKING